MPEFPESGLSFSPPKPFLLRAREKVLMLGQPVVMGILNLSPDSFYAGSRTEAAGKLLDKAGQMLGEGAKILDIGALSSRPGSEEIPEDEEIDRLLPGLTLLRKHFPDVLISADVYRSKVVEAALAGGADIINNIQGIVASGKLLGQIADAGAALIIMHSRGVFSEMHRASVYESTAAEVASELAFAIRRAQQAGITSIMADPGFGFSKNLSQNFSLFSSLHYLCRMLDCPVLAGISRKSMIYRSLQCGPEDALNGTTALHMAALLQGVHVLRVHDVKPAAETIRLFQKVCLPES